MPPRHPRGLQHQFLSGDQRNRPTWTAECPALDFVQLGWRRWSVKSGASIKILERPGALARPVITGRIFAFAANCPFYDPGCHRGRNNLFRRHVVASCAAPQETLHPRARHGKSERNLSTTSNSPFAVKQVGERTVTCGARAPDAAP